jgi:hypothetical protein
MKTETNKAPKGVIVFNYASLSEITLTEKEVPTLVSESKMNALLGDEQDPYYKIEAIPYPANGSGGIYEESFFRSFVNGLKDRPYPGSKRGHEYTSRPSSDFYMVGGSMVGNADGKGGIAYFKMLIPTEGDTTSNAGFIRDAKAGIVHFSLVSAPEYKEKKDDDGVTRRHYTASKGYERNDAVEYKTGAMDQVVNSAEEETDFDEAKELATKGEWNRKDTNGKVIQNGKVSYSVLRRLASNANCENKTEIAELISIMDKQKNHGGMKVDKKEVLETVQNMKANGEITLAEIANAMGLQDKIVNDEHVKNAETVKVLNEKLGADPITAIDGLLANKKIAADLAVVNAVVKLAGPEKIMNSSGVEVINPSYTHAIEKCAKKEGKDLETAIANLGEDPIMKILQGQRADAGSSFNKNENRETKTVPAYNGGIKTISVGGK